MPFRFRCPKCAGTNFTITEGQKAMGLMGKKTDSRVFSCVCGTRLFGEKIDEALEFQKKKYQEYYGLNGEEMELERREEEEKQSKLDAALAYNKQWRREQQAQARAERARKEREDYERWRESTQEVEAPAPAPAPKPRPEPRLEKAPELCAWDPCTKPKRPTSKYCSRDCSNKNARWRYKQKKEQEKARKRSAA